MTTFSSGQVLTAAQLNTAFAGATITSGTIDGATIGGTTPAAGSFSALSAGKPNTQTGAAYTVLSTDCSIIFNSSAGVTITLPSAASFPGRILMIKTIAAYTVVSASSNVVPIGTNAAGTAILAATAGKYVLLQSDSTNWITMMAN
jgi:hypothetical protein